MRTILIAAAALLLAGTAVAQQPPTCRNPAWSASSKARPSSPTPRNGRRLQGGADAGRAGQGRASCRRSSSACRRSRWSQAAAQRSASTAAPGGAASPARRQRERQPHRARADKLLFWDYTGTKIVPDVAKGWEVSDDGKSTTLCPAQGHEVVGRRAVHRRRLRVLVRGHLPEQGPDADAGAGVARSTASRADRKVDETTVEFEFDEPYFLFPEMLAGDTQVGGGQSRCSRTSATRALCAGALPEAVPAEVQLGRGAERSRPRRPASTTGSACSSSRPTGALNPELPALSPWKTVQPINTPDLDAGAQSRTIWAVDTDGNQLPYIDKIQLTLAENLEVINLRAIAGEYDLQERHIDLGKLPVFLENQQKGNYNVHLDPGFNGADSALKFNLSYRGRPRDREVVRQPSTSAARSRSASTATRSTRRSCSASARRASVVPADIIPYSPGHGVADEVGHARRQAGQRPARQDRAEQEGRRGLPPAHRQRPAPAHRDRRGATLSPTWPQQAEMIVQQWKTIGIAGRHASCSSAACSTRACATTRTRW